MSYSNACSVVRSIGIVGWAHSAIVTAGAVEQRNRGKDVAALESHPLFPKSIRAITYIFWQIDIFYKSEEILYFLQF